MPVQERGWPALECGGLRRFAFLLFAPKKEKRRRPPHSKARGVQPTFPKDEKMASSAAVSAALLSFFSPQRRKSGGDRRTPKPVPPATSERDTPGVRLLVSAQRESRPQRCSDLVRISELGFVGGLEWRS